MIVKCTYKAGTGIPHDLLERGYTSETIINITLDRLYAVYAMCIWQGEIHFLLLNDETQRPNWYPCRFFEIHDSQLPSNWHFGYIGGETGWPLQEVWGYRELATDGGHHYSQLIQRDHDALTLFLIRQSEIDAENVSDV